MGRARRMKQSSNPTHAGSVRFVAKRTFDNAMVAGATMVAKFSDRSYIMDARGTMRRVPPPPDTRPKLTIHIKQEPST